MTGQDFFSIADSVENYTPRKIWERAGLIMGGIDVDPASDPDHNIPAAIHFIRRDDGLSQEWPGRVWLNPPFGRGIEKWFEKLALEFREGRTTEAVVLWKAALETGAMRILVSIPEYRYSAVPRKRISYLTGEQKKRGGGDSATFTTMLHYFGPNGTRFTEVFGEICDIWICVSTVARDQRRLLSIEEVVA